MIYVVVLLKVANKDPTFYSTVSGTNILWSLRRKASFAVSAHNKTIQANSEKGSSALFSE